MKSFFDKIFWTALFSVVLYLLASPAVFCWEVNLWPLVFFVPAIWARLIRCETFAETQFRYTKIWVCAFGFWLATTFWICFPHPLTSLGWIALSAYLAVYLPVFIAVSRHLTRRYPLPTYFVCPVVWVCVEWFRNHVFGGFSPAALEHSLYKVPLLIQTADLGGQYLVGAQIVFLGCCLERIFVPLNPRKTPLTAALGVLLFMLAYGWYQTPNVTSDDQSPPIRIAATQGNYPVTLNPPEGQGEKTFRQYCKLSEDAVKQAEKDSKPLHLIVWPETVYPYPMFEFCDGFTPDDWDMTPEEALEESRKFPLSMASCWNTPLLLGVSTYSFTQEKENRLNSVVLVDPLTQTVGPRYDKVHLVMFGEYVPLAGYLPDDFPLKTLCQTASRGTKPVAIPIPGTDVFLSANICFEGLVPHLVRGQVAELRRQGKEPAILINLSNVGWFYFTSQIDLQLATQVFRAVENRKPYITAANGGISAYIDATGKIVNRGKRKEAVSFISEIQPDGRKSFYTAYGDVFAYGCLILTAVLLIRKFQRSNKSEPQS
ncbi:MAG: apolipoprotein N-acyltransferase [Planctomycetaceae bacterium]|nr:apolipoprotein N-acyltransferase [Planctomycetaceae bacterium]